MLGSTLKSEDHQCRMENFYAPIFPTNGALELCSLFSFFKPDQLRDGDRGGEEDRGQGAVLPRHQDRVLRDPGAGPQSALCLQIRTKVFALKTPSLLHFYYLLTRKLETEAVTVTVEFSTPCVTQIVTVCDPGKVEKRRRFL